MRAYVCVCVFVRETEKEREGYQVVSNIQQTVSQSDSRHSSTKSSLIKKEGQCNGILIDTPKKLLKKPSNPIEG